MSDTEKKKHHQIWDKMDSREQEKAIRRHMAIKELIEKHNAKEVNQVPPEDTPAKPINSK